MYGYIAVNNVLLLCVKDDSSWHNITLSVRGIEDASVRRSNIASNGWAGALEAQSLPARHFLEPAPANRSSRVDMMSLGADLNSC